MKICKRCLKEKEENDFYKWRKKSGRSGLKLTCKDCQNEINKNYRVKNKEKITLRRRERIGCLPKKLCLDPLKKKQYERIYKSKKKYPEKVFARNFLNGLLRIGKIKKPIKCQLCHEEKKLEAHHDDYLKPSMVKWVCKKCHTIIHFKK